MFTNDNSKRLFLSASGFCSQFKIWMRKILLPIYKPSRSNLLPSFWRYLLMKPAIFEIWYRLRAFWFITNGTGIISKEAPVSSGPGGFVKRVMDYNQSKIWEFYRVRTEKFMALLRCIDAIPRNAKILCIGPRNEAEVLLLSLYGFPLKNIKSIDLFSYSPLIRCMDMHKLDFPDNCFDIVYSAWTLKYSYDFPLACAEIIRVSKPGAIVATGFSHTSTLSDEVGTPLTDGLTDLMSAFENNVDWIYWKEISACPDDAEEISVIFSIKKLNKFFIVD